MKELQSKTRFENLLSDEIYLGNAITIDKVNIIFEFFKQHSLFIWTNAHNDCEDRANAICILLDQWKVPNYKGWVFSGYFHKNEQGTLIDLWNYHVAAAIPVSIDNFVYLYIIDPGTLENSQTIEFWASNITVIPYSYHLLKKGSYYIFPTEFVERDNWHWRNEENYLWTIEGLAGINGVTVGGEDFINNNKKIIVKTRTEFEMLKNSPYPFNNSQ